MERTINDIKAEIFDILVQQERFRNAIAQLDQAKNDKLEELNELQRGTNSETVGTADHQEGHGDGEGA